MADHFSNDEIRASILFETDKGQQKIHELGKAIDELEAKRKIHLQTMAKEEREGRKSSDLWKAAKKQYDKLGKQIKHNREEIDKETKALDINNMTMAQLRKQSKALRRELENLQEYTKQTKRQNKN